MKVLRVIELMYIVLLLASCRTGDDEPQEEKLPAVINVYVYAPEHPIVTRADVGEVAPVNNESTINTLQIWVFEHNTNNLIAYYMPESVSDLNSSHGVTYQLSASEAFTQVPDNDKPNVDVYVLANVASCGLSPDENTTRDALEAALIEDNYFGLSSLTTVVPEAGLPMSGVQRDVTVTGIAPVYNISTVKLTRAVSKLRFVFCRETVGDGQTDPDVKITSISLNAGMIPEQEYLFLADDGNPYHIKGGYKNTTTELLPPNSTLRNKIEQNDDPIKYTYQGQEAQVYEDLINDGLETKKNELGETVREPELSEVGPFYLRESDKQLTGTITFTYTDTGGTKTGTATFEMRSAGDFSRNHTWIVYAYYGNSGLEVNSVYVKDWDETTKSHSVYNW